MRLLFAIGFAIFYLATSCAQTLMPPPTPRTPSRQVHVIVVGVTKFAIDNYNNDVLKLAFEERCNDIKSFFEDHLGSENVSSHVFCTPETTTREVLRHFFSIEVPQFSAGTLTLIFLMSHGETATFDNAFLGNDLEFITSDTKASDPVSDTDRQRQFSSILLGSELLSWLQHVPAGSTILTFVDTCHAGAVASLSTSISQFVQQNFGLGSLVVASSLKGDVTYSAWFTKALLDVWAQDGCLDVDSLSDKIYTKMKTLAPITGSEGIPSVPVRYNGPLCLGNFGQDHRLLFIYAGRDAEQKPYRYAVAESAPTGTHTVIEEKSLSYLYMPIPLDAKKYVVTVNRDPDVHQSFNVDLTSVGHQLIWLDSSASAADVGNAGETLAQVAEINGSPTEEVAAIRQATVAIYRAAGMDTEAFHVLAQMQAKGEALPIAPEIQQVAFQPAASVRQVVMTSHFNPIVAAEQLRALGDFQNAGDLLHTAADQEASGNNKVILAGQAYEALSAAGDTAGATAVAQQYPQIKAVVGTTPAANQALQGRQILNSISIGGIVVGKF